MLEPGEESKASRKAIKRVLVVDDEPDIITYITTVLEDKGYWTMQARSAKEAMKILKQVKPDLVCLDIMMPGLSGIALYQTMKIDERFNDIPTVFISAYSMARDFSSKGFRKLVPDPRVPEPDAYIEKPFDAEKLIETLQGLIG